MSYTVLARKYRSQTFDEVIGQGAIAQTLKNAIKTGRVAHAFLFSGTRGVGKTTMARILAKALNCHSFEQATTKPCCKCDSCIAANAGEDIDIIEIDGASNNGVEEVRKLRENAVYRPARSRFKIYIIDEVHMLSTAAFNALLKTLEEPPEHVKFIFATTEPNKVIATIQSRCQRFDFNNISPKQIAEHLADVLKQEKIKYDDSLVLHLAKMANGSMRDGLSLLDRLISTGVEPLTTELLEKFLGCPNSKKISELVDRIGNSDAAGTLEVVGQLVDSGLGEVQVIDALIDYMRDLMVVKSAGVDSTLLILTEQQRIQAGQSAKEFDIAGLVYNITTLEKLRWTIKNSESGRALLEAALLRFALTEHFLNVDALLAQVETNKLGISKKKGVKITTMPPEVKSEQVLQEIPALPAISNLNSLKDNWQDILAIVSENLGKGTSGLLVGAEPTGLENGILTLTFSAAAEVSKQMCESNSRAKAIEEVLNKIVGQDIVIKFETAINTNGDGQENLGTIETRSEKKNKIVSDPAIKTIVMGLGATITGIDEKN